MPKNVCADPRADNADRADDADPRGRRGSARPRADPRKANFESREKTHKNADADPRARIRADANPGQNNPIWVKTTLFGSN